MKYQVLLFYKYVTVEDPEALAGRVRELAEQFSLLGRVIVATEGINATLEGTVDGTEAFVLEICKEEGLCNMEIKRSTGTGQAFPKLSVKLRSEIVGTQFDASVDPRVKTGTKLSPSELREWFENGEEFEVIDMRNDYEYRSGHFKNSINPGLEASRDLPSAMPKLAPLQNKKVLTVCTGGIRCEKMSAYLLANGFTDVYQLDGGIHSYMEQYPGKDFEGTLYTFDQRLVMDFGGERTIVGRCHHCNSETEEYTNCANLRCHLHFLVCQNCKGEEGTYCSSECRETISL